MAKKEPQLKFNNESEREQATVEFLNLKNQAGWQRIIKYYEEKVKYLESLLAEGDIKDIPELKLIRARRNMAIQFMNLPDLILEFIERKEGVSPDLDPYDSEPVVDNVEDNV